MMPRPMLMVERHDVPTPRFPAIDAHNHLGPFFGCQWSSKPAGELPDVLDQAGIRNIVDLDGGFGENFYREMEKWSCLGDRVLVFSGVAWQRLAGMPSFGDIAAREFEHAVGAGARGLKIWKDFGLRVRDGSGKLIPIDTPDLDPLWAAAGELGVPVLIHTGDPAAFFEPLDDTNERWHELQRTPEWSFHGPEFPRLETLLGALQRVVARHPRTTFIGAHVGCYAENLAYVGAMLDRLPNYYIDISARAAELGRQPNTARRFFLRYADRILFGTDNAPDAKAYKVYYRLLETTDDSFPYWPSGDRPWQGRWYIHGLGLPDAVLQRVYYRNAARIFKIAEPQRVSVALAGEGGTEPL